MKRKDRPRHILPDKEYGIPRPIVIHAPKVAFGRFKVVYRIGTPQANKVACIQHPDAVVTFLTLVDEVLAVSTQHQENITAQRMGGSNEPVSNPHARTIGSLLHQAIAFVRFDIWNGNRSNTRIIELPHRLFNHLRRGKRGIVIN